MPRDLYTLQIIHCVLTSLYMLDLPKRPLYKCWVNLLDPKCKTWRRGKETKLTTYTEHIHCMHTLSVKLNQTWLHYARLGSQVCEIHVGFSPINDRIGVLTGSFRGSSVSHCNLEHKDNRIIFIWKQVHNTAILTQHPSSLESRNNSF